MATLYLTEPGTALQKDGETLVITRDGQSVETVPLIKVDQVVVMGQGIKVTTPALFTLVRKGIDLTYLTGKSGRFVARMQGEAAKFVQLRFRQSLMVANPAGSIAFAREFVRGKLHNQRALVLRHSTRGAESRRAISGIQAMLDRLDGTADADVLRGLEGQSAALYFPAFARMLNRDMGFSRRIYYPPTDPVNAMLSFGYTMLLHRIMGAIGIVGLDPYLGFFHVVDYGRPSLALDIEEEFRPVLVDSLVLSLVNSHAIGPDDFVPARNKRGVLLTDPARERYIEAFETRLASPLLYPPTNQTTTYTRGLELQCRQVARCLMGQQSSYQALLLR